MADPVLEPVTDLRAVAQRIKDDLPLSASVHNAMLLNQDGHSDVYAFYRLKGDSYSHLTLYTGRTAKRDFIMVGFHALPSEAMALKNVLKKTNLFDWTTDKILFFHVQHFLLEAMLEASRDMGIPNLRPALAELFVYEPGGIGQPDDVICPSGFRILRLGKEGVQRMFDTWKYKSVCVEDEFILLAEDAPAVGIYVDNAAPASKFDVRRLTKADDEEVPVAWGTVASFGPLGILKVEDSHKGLGLRKLVVGACRKLFLKKGYVPHFYTNGKEERDFFMSLPDWKKMSDTYWVGKK